MTMTYKEMVKAMTHSDLKCVHYHYAIQGTLEIYTDIINDGDRDEGWNEEGFAECVDDTFSEMNFTDEDLKQIEDMILNEYNEELTAINQLANSKHRP
ncbi:MAG: hypothetical protein CTY12_00580 [Methylotenera sp.]|nr:MAG: hypothetical protein CTY12_00580 [Methylotenera sp.]